MKQLTLGMYGSELKQKSALFGIRCGQMCGGQNKMTHNSGWYNKSGEKLGWGDLSIEDMVRISKQLNVDELFIVLGEGASSWYHATNGIPEMTPGIGYVMRHAMYVIAHGKMVLVTECDYGNSITRNICGHDFMMLRRTAIARLVAESWGGQ